MRQILMLPAVGSLAIAAFLALAPASYAETVTFKANLSAADEVPPNPSTGTGSVTATYDTATKTLSWDGTFSGLTGPVAAAHIHGPAPAGKNAGVVFWISDHNTKDHPFTSPFKGSATLDDKQADDLMAGQYYVNLHTAAHPGGEVRGQLVK